MMVRAIISRPFCVYTSVRIWIIGKYLLMLRAIRRGIKLPRAKDHPWFNECLCRFLMRISELKPEPGNLVHEALLQEIHAVFGDNELPGAAKTNDDFMRRNSKSFLHVFRGKYAVRTMF